MVDIKWYLKKRYSLKVPKQKLREAYEALISFSARKRNARLMLTQVLMAVVALIGISYYSVPVALIIGGVGGILAVERQ